MMVDPKTGFATFDIEGSEDPTKVAGGCYSLARPIPPGATNLNQTYIFTVDSDYAANCNSTENDDIFTIPDPKNPANGMNLNGSIQTNNAEGGELQISDAASGWINTGIFPGIFTPFPAVHTLKTLYQLNRPGGIVLVNGFLYDEASYPLAPSLGTIVGADKGWADLNKVMLQIQQMLKIGGTKYQITYQHINLTWS